MSARLLGCHRNCANTTSSSDSSDIIGRHRSEGRTDTQIRKGAEVVRKQVQASFNPKSNFELNRTEGSDSSPNSVMKITPDESIQQIYEDLNTSEESWPEDKQTRYRLNLGQTSSRRTRKNEKVEKEPPTQSWMARSNANESITSSNLLELSSVFSGEGMEVTDQEYLNLSSQFLSPISAEKSNFRSMSSRRREVRARSVGSVVQPLHDDYGDQSKRWDDQSLDDDILELKSPQFDFPGQDNWDNGSLEINEIQNNVYLLKPADYNDDNTPIKDTFRRAGALSPTDDICTIMEESAKIVKQGRQSSAKASLQTLRTTRNRSLLETDEMVTGNGIGRDKDRRHPNSYSLKDFKSSNRSRSNKLAGVSSRSDGYFSSTPTVPDADVTTIPPPLGHACEMLIQDPAYRHAQHAGCLWQTMMGQHVRFPSSWWNGARAPPMGVSSVETSKWCYYGRQTVRNNSILNQLIKNRTSAGRLLLHVIVQDIITRQAVQDIAVGCFHPNAKGVRKTARAERVEENSRELWIATRKRARNYVSSIDRLLSNQSSWGESGYSKSPLGPEARVTNHNVRAIFGETPPLETLFVSESELYERLVERTGGNNVPLSLTILQEFVLAD